ncbi:hypothetical protein F511_04190 [Dorcoceras hygrometricum]|uniref:Uncharacterized protein n=1 Tax=Dorcoceras hygrometricum TaxID=472368 RepID=A0A2Z7BIN5_9LAMI|nr:hypothetical protein F511_04190 [Dorcoceras hygrometricum]
MCRFDDSANKLGSCRAPRKDLAGCYLRHKAKSEASGGIPTKALRRSSQWLLESDNDSREKYCLSRTNISVAVWWSGGGFVMCVDVGRGRRRSGGGEARGKPDDDGGCLGGGSSFRVMVATLRCCGGRLPRGKDLSVLMVNRDSDRISSENSSDEGGKKIDLAEVRALQNGACRRPVKAPWVRPSRKRVVPNSRDAPRRTGSPRSSDRRISPQPRQYHATVGKSTNDRRKDLGSKSSDVPRQSGDDDAKKSLKRGQELGTGAQHNVSGGGNLFLKGANRRDRAGSFWDLNDPDLSWNMGKTLIGDHDVLHLLPQPTESLTHALAWNAFQVLSLASAFQLQEERSRNSESKLHEEIAMLREELLKKQKESDEKSKSSDTLRVELEEKSKSYDVLRQELQQLEEKYSVELTTGEHFLSSAMGKTLLMSTGEKTIEGYRASSTFRDEVLQQALTIHDQVVIDCRRQLRETKLVSEDKVNDRA